jgi:hypothetical protein
MKHDQRGFDGTKGNINKEAPFLSLSLSLSPALAQERPNILRESQSGRPRRGLSTNSKIIA